MSRRRVARRARVVAVLLFTVTIAFTTAAAQTDAPSRGAVSMGEGGFRKMVTSMVMPVYPRESLRKKSRGVAVAQVRTGTSGRVERVDVLEAPDPAMATAVASALRQWTVTPPVVKGEHEPRPVHDKVTFYFTIAGGVGRVRNPDEMPGNTDVFGRAASAPSARGRATAAAPSVVWADDISAREIGEADLDRLVASAHAVVLDVRDRDEFARSHRAGDVNIPRNEVFVRAGAELPRARPIVVDCAQGERSSCRAATLRLTERGFTDVLLFVP